MEPRISQLLDQLINDWDFRHEHEYLKKSIKLISDSAASSDRQDSELIHEIRRELSPEDWQNLRELVLKQVLLKYLREYLERDVLKADDYYQTICTDYISSEEYKTEKSNIGHRKRERQLQRKSHEKARRKKQTLLKNLKEHFERDFLTADDYYRTHCTDYISFKEYENEKINYVWSWAKEHLNANPDTEQTKAIGAIEGHVKVVARAGSGKTTTLVTRALFLQQHCGVKPDEMLLLAFNLKAAEEMQKRLTSYLQSSIPHVMTFHALAYALVHPEEKIIKDEPEDEKSQSRAIQDVIDGYRHNPNYYDKIRTLMMAYFRADWDRIILGDRNPAEMLCYRRSLSRESLNGDYVKSFGEKVIANFLFEHDIKYKYERNFWWNDGNYRPDFTIGDKRGIIIEYFGRKGDPDYDVQSEEKRNYWRNEPNWRLLEFVPDNLTSNGVEGFYSLLKQRLEACKIPCNRLSEEEIWDRIKDHRAIDRFTKVTTGFIKHCRKLALTPEELSKRVNNHDCVSEVEQGFLDLAQVFGFGA